MFSVPGWNLSAPLATQVEKPKVKEGGASEGKKSQKRRQKREQRQQVEIDEGNVGEYWEKVVGGKDSEQQTTPSETSNAIAPPNAEANAEKAGKKRKRKSDKKAAQGAEEAKLEDEDASKTGTVDEPSKRDKKKRKKDHKPAPSSDNAVKPSAQPSATATVPPLIPEPSNLTPLQKSMRAKLISARFRHLNESLYTKPSKESLDLFKDNPDMFEDYHRGFAQQVEIWPENPVDGYVEAVLSRGKLRTKDPWKDKKRQDKNKKGGNNDKVPKEESNDAASPSSNLKPLPRNPRGHCTIADLGCGTASLSYRLQPSLKPLNLTLHSFDLSKPTGPTANLVTIADISALPLPDSSVDVAIFCLALMGTNWLDFVDEAWRILRWRGELWVSEIKSRFGRVGRAKGAPPINSVGSLRKVEKKQGGKGKGKGGKKEGGAEKEGPQDSADEAELATQVDGVETGQEGTDVGAFVAALRARGFVLDAPIERLMDAVDLSNKMFVKMQFVKGVAPTKGKNVDAAKEREREKGKGGATGAMRMGMKGKKFAAVAAAGGDDDGGDEADAKVLKPCLYKIR